MRLRLLDELSAALPPAERLSWLLSPTASASDEPCAMPCYAVLWLCYGYAMAMLWLCCAMLCYAMLCHVMPCHAMPCLLCQASASDERRAQLVLELTRPLPAEAPIIPYHTMPYHTIACHTIPYHTIP